MTGGVPARGRRDVRRERHRQERRRVRLVLLLVVLVVVLVSLYIVVREPPDPSSAVRDAPTAAAPAD